jgi:hypothetical protein
MQGAVEEDEPRRKLRGYLTPYSGFLAGPDAGATRRTYKMLMRITNQKKS